MSDDNQSDGHAHRSPHAPKADRISELETALRNAIDQWPEFDRDEPVSGADLVDWFAAWRLAVKELLAE